MSVRLYSAHTRTLSRSSIRRGLIPLEAVTGKPAKVRTVDAAEAWRGGSLTCVVCVGPQLRHRPFTADDFFESDRPRLSRGGRVQQQHNQQHHDRPSRSSSRRPASIFHAHEFSIGR